MDKERFDQWSRVLGGSTSRRGALALAASALAGWAADSAAKKKKKRKKKKKASAGRCVKPYYQCSTDAQCCATPYSPEQPICRVRVHGPDDHKTCCVPHHAPIEYFNTMCCGGYDEEAPEGGRRCCIDMGFPDEGHPEFCCQENPSINGTCCIWEGWSCAGGLPCCPGSTCIDDECQAVS